MELYWTDMQNVDCSMKWTISSSINPSATVLFFKTFISYLFALSKTSTGARFCHTASCSLRQRRTNSDPCRRLTAISLIKKPSSVLEFFLLDLHLMIVARNRHECAIFCWLIDIYLLFARNRCLVLGSDSG